MSSFDVSLLIELYCEENTPADALPYTDKFDVLCRKFSERSGQPVEHHALWRQLCRLRKQGRLPRLRR